MTRRIAWLNEKGGSGKSTSALNISANLATRFGKKVLMVDVDHQANITAVLTKSEPQAQTLTDVLMDDAPVEEVIRKTPYENLHLLPADASLSEVNVAMADPSNPLGMGRELRLKRVLNAIDSGYDFVVVDTSPQRTLLNVNVLNYVEEVFVPIDPGYFSIMGVQNLEKLLQQVREYMDHRTLRISGVLLTKMQHTNVAREVEKQIRDYFGDLVMKVSIPLNVKVEEAHSRGVSVGDYAPESPGAQAYLAVTEQILAYEHQTNGFGAGVAAPAPDDGTGSTANA